MERPALDRASLRSPYADQLNQGFARLRFNGLLEKEFRQFYVAQNLPRGRLALLTALGPLCVLAVIQLLVDEPHHPLTLWRTALFPLLAATSVAVYLPAAKRYYTAIAGASVLLSGGLITYFSHAEALAGGANLLAAQALALLFACVFLGLLFDVA